MESCFTRSWAAVIHYRWHCNKCWSLFISGGEVFGGWRAMCLGWDLWARRWGNAGKPGWSEHGGHLSNLHVSPALLIRKDLPVSLYSWGYSSLTLSCLLWLYFSSFWVWKNVRKREKRETKRPVHQRGFASTGLKLYICKRDVPVPISADMH